MTDRLRLGMLTPSSNTTLEPLTTAMLAGIPAATAHFARFPVTEIALSGNALAQFDPAPILDAATLLSHAKVHTIGWSGTSASWLGFDSDRRLCERITAATGTPATTSVLALNELLTLTGVRRLGLVTPYTGDVQTRIIANYAAQGIACPAERHLSIRDNYAFAEVPAATLADMIRAVAAGKPDAIAVVCTNLAAAPLVAALEVETGVAIHDSIAAIVWKSLLIAGADPRQITGWGRLFATRPNG